MSASRGHARIETAAMLIAVFIAGGLGGAALERRSHDRERVDRRGGFLGTSGSIPRSYEELDLSADQRTRIHAILENARPETDSLLRTALPRLRELTRSTREAIADVLTDEQRAELEEHSRERRDRYRGRSGGRGGDHRTGREDSIG